MKLNTFDTKVGLHLHCPSCNTFYNSEYINKKINFDLYNDGDFHEKYVKRIPNIINSDYLHYNRISKIGDIPNWCNGEFYDTI